MKEEASGGHLAEAAAAIRRGDLTQAISSYRAALSISPALPHAWFNLGWALRASRAFEDALTAYDQALATGFSDRDAVIANRAAILADHLGDPKAARLELERAAARGGGSIALLVNLGVLHEDAGNHDDAMRTYAKAVLAAPGNGRAWARLATLQAATEASQAERKLVGALDQADGLVDRAEILFALGNILDRQYRYEEAFQAYEAANFIAAALRATKFDRVAHAKLINDLRTLRMEPGRLVPPTNPQPVFVCGMFRSGSTLFEHLLSQRTAVAAGGELETIPALVQSMGPRYPEALKGATDICRAQWRRSYLSDLERFSSGTSVVTDKRCDNFMHIGFILSLFPTAPIVHTRRFALDTILSVYFLHFGEGGSYTFDLDDIAFYFIEYRRMMDYWSSQYGASIIHVDYENVTRDTENEIGRIASLLGLPVTSGIRQNKASNIRTPSAWQVRSDVHTRSIGRWKNYQDKLDKTRQLLEAAGIDPDH